MSDIVLCGICGREGDHRNHNYYPESAINFGGTHGFRPRKFGPHEQMAIKLHPGAAIASGDNTDVVFARVQDMIDASLAKTPDPRHDVTHVDLHINGASTSPAPPPVRVSAKINHEPTIGAIAADECGAVGLITHRLGFGLWRGIRLDVFGPDLDILAWSSMKPTVLTTVDQLATLPRGIGPEVIAAAQRLLAPKP